MSDVEGPATRPLFLIGFMGAGKSTVGRIVAERLDRPFCDLDDEIAKATGMSVDELFATLGEPGFRAAEREALIRVSERSDMVCACGGGVVTDEGNRALMCERGDVVYLVVSPEEALARVGAETAGRPLLRGSSLESASGLLASRVRLYEAAADLTVVTCGCSPDEVAETIVEWVVPVNDRKPDEVVIQTGRGFCSIYVGTGMLFGLGGVIHKEVGEHGGLCAVVTDDNVGRLYEPKVAETLFAYQIPSFTVVIPAGEKSKTWQQAGTVLEAFSEAHMGRDGMVVALGGGVVGDLAGFAASTYLRGVPVYQVPTTLLAMVDSSIGGKTGVDLPAGKNLAGSFWSPTAVLIDTSLLATLPESEWKSGFGEVVKSAFLAGESQVEILERDAEQIVAHVPLFVRRAVLMSVRLKARVVEADEREARGREALNYGHTLAHALERELGYGTVPHGLAVADGMRFAARLAVKLGHSTPEWAERQERLLDAFGLPRLSLPCEPGALLAAMRSDKKSRAGQIRMVFSTHPGGWIARSVEDDVLTAALEEWCGVEGVS